VTMGCATRCLRRMDGHTPDEAARCNPKLSRQLELDDKEKRTCDTAEFLWNSGPLRVKLQCDEQRRSLAVRCNQDGHESLHHALRPYLGDLAVELAKLGRSCSRILFMTASNLVRRRGVDAVGVVALRLSSDGRSFCGADWRASDGTSAECHSHGGCSRHELRKRGRAFTNGPSAEALCSFRRTPKAFSMK